MSKAVTRTVIFLICFVIGVFGMILYAKSIHTSEVHQTIQKPKKVIPFSIENAPSDSLRGEIATLSGTVLWQSRVATEGARIVSPRPMQQGEEITTQTGTATVTFPQTFDLTLSPNSTVDFIQTLPQHLVLGQTSGKVTYATHNPSVLSVRTGPLLVRFESGMGVITLMQKRTISVASGSATIAFNDADQKSTLMSLTKGQTFIFDDETRKGIIQ